MNKRNLWQDPVPEAGERPACHFSKIIPGKRGRILSILYLPSGARRAPVLLMCHGFPGNEQNMDLAQAFRRIGFAVMKFHYSGSWGSDGNYSVSNCLEDAQTVLDYLKNYDGDELDPERIFLFGHSLGGFVTANILARNPEIQAGILLSPADMGGVYSIFRENEQMKENWIRFLDDGAKWLNGTSGEALAEDLEAHLQEWTFTGLAESLSEIPLLIISAEQDALTPFETNQKPLLLKLEEIRKGNYRHVTFDTDHGYEDKRIILTETIAEFLLENLSQ